MTQKRLKWGKWWIVIECVAYEWVLSPESDYEILPWCGSMDAKSSAISIWPMSRAGKRQRFVKLDLKFSNALGWCRIQGKFVFSLLFFCCLLQIKTLNKRKIYPIITKMFSRTQQHYLCVSYAHNAWAMHPSFFHLRQISTLRMCITVWTQAKCNWQTAKG